MGRTAKSKRSNPYLSPEGVAEVPPSPAAARPLPWFCRIAFVGSCLLSIAALTPEFLDSGWLGTGDGNGLPQLLHFDADAMQVVVRWTFGGVGLLAGLLLLAGRRSGIWPAYLFAALGAVVFGMVVVWFRASGITLGGGVSSLGLTIVVVALCAFLGGGSLAYYVLALHVFRQWSSEVPQTGAGVTQTANGRNEAVR